MKVPKHIEEEIRAILNFPDVYTIEGFPLSPDKFKIGRKAGVGLYSLSREVLVIACVCRKIDELSPDSFGVLFQNN
jgi:hypothetical protein